MLVLSRGKNESVMIGDAWEVTVAAILSDKVRLGVTTPPDVPVHRREVYEAIQRARRQAELTSKSAEAEGMPGQGIRRPRAQGSTLMFSRRRNEGIMIGDDVMVVVVEIRGDKVRLGIQVPQTISLRRKEVWETLRREEQSREAEGADEQRVTPPSEEG